MGGLQRKDNRSPKAEQEQNMIKDIIAKAYKIYRRKFYAKFRKEYIKRSIAKRQGKCLHCGGCCATAMIPCIHYDYSNKECKIWKNKGYSYLSQNCKNYPFDEKDKSPYSKRYCGFYWIKDVGAKL